MLAGTVHHTCSSLPCFVQRIWTRSEAAIWAQRLTLASHMLFGGCCVGRSLVEQGEHKFRVREGNEHYSALGGAQPRRAVEAIPNPHSTDVRLGISCFSPATVTVCRKLIWRVLLVARFSSRGLAGLTLASRSCGYGSKMTLCLACFASLDHALHWRQ